MRKTKHCGGESMTSHLFITMCICLVASFVRFLEGDELCHFYMLMAVICFNGMNIVAAITRKDKP